jgi:hypothetical protein
LAGALLAAVIVSAIVRGVCARISALDRLKGQGGRSLGHVLSDIAYCVVLMLFMPPVFQALGMRSVFEPVQTMLSKLVGFFPNLLASAVILLVGGFMVRLLREVVTNPLSSMGADSLAKAARVDAVTGPQRISSVVGTVVYAVAYVPVLLAALHALQIEPVTRPVSNMMDKMVGAVPNLFAAFLLMTVAYLVSTVVAELITSVTASVGADHLMERIGLSSAGNWKLSEVLGRLVTAAMLFLTAMEAARLIGFDQFASILGDLMQIAGNILLGMVIFCAGMYLSRLAGDAVRNTMAGAGSETAALVARAAVLVLATAISLRRMGLANEIVNLAFGLLIGALAVAFGIAFGIGGKDAAAQWIAEARSNSNKVTVKKFTTVVSGD